MKCYNTHNWLINLQKIICIATRLMIKNLSMRRGATLIKLQWSARRFHPVYYYQTISCNLWPERMPYLYVNKVTDSNATSSLVASLKPGSKCVIRFSAVYNLARLDQGITVIASTPFERNDRNVTPLHK